MKRILKEPLLHFLLLGAAIFTVYGLVSKRTGGEPGKIVITQGQIESMAAGYTRTWQRPPTSEELEGLIHDRVREEVYYREALALGLDKDDIIIRRRLRQKLEFVTDDVVAQAQPTDDELSAYLKAHPDRFRVPQQFTFSQVYLNPEEHGEALARDAGQLLAQLNEAGSKADISALGDSLVLDHKLVRAPDQRGRKTVGREVRGEVGGLAPGQWQGPIESGYGMHLVFVSERTEGRLPALAEVRDAVSREWVNTRQLEANEKLYEAMLKRYVVTIERPQPAAEKLSLADSEMKGALLIVALLATFAPDAFAHEVRPAYLELRQTAPDTYDVLWKVPGLGDNLRLGIYVELPAGCTNVKQPRGSMLKAAFTGGAGR